MESPDVGGGEGASEAAGTQLRGGRANGSQARECAGAEGTAGDVHRSEEQ